MNEVEWKPFLQLISVFRPKDLRFWFVNANFIGSSRAEIFHEKDVNCAERCELPEEHRGYIMETTGNGAEV